MIIVIYLVRCTRFRPHFGVLTMVLLYLFCAARLLLPLEFPHTVIVSDSVAYPRIYNFLTRKPEPVTHLPVGLLLCAIWLFGTVFLLIRYALQYRKAIRAARQAKPWDSRTASLLSEIRRQTGRTIKVRGRTAANIESAFGVGVLRRYIILPDKTYTDAELHYILLHEYTHFLNHDTAVKLLVTLYCIIFWWNPVVYLLQKDLEQTLELKCDRAIAQTLNAQERTAYLRAILSAMKHGCTQQPCRSRPRPCFAPRRTRPCGSDSPPCSPAQSSRTAEPQAPYSSAALPSCWHCRMQCCRSRHSSRRPSLTAARPSILTTRMPISSKVRTDDTGCALTATSRMR